MAAAGGGLNVAMTFHLHGPADPQAIGRIVSQRLNQVARGALHDGAYD
jgi:hypothetical protein